MKTNLRLAALLLSAFPTAALAQAAPIDVQALTDIGDTKAGEGLPALQAWWTSLSKPAQHALKDKLTAWKEKAA